MKQIVPFKKEITFKTMINKITSISLEHTLELSSDAIISGDFIVSGSYKMTEASQLDEEFSYKIPIEITIDDKYDTSNVSLEIDDFVYAILEEETLSLNIDLCIDNLELKKEEVIETIFTEPEEIELDNTLREIEATLEEEYLREGQEEVKDLFLDNSIKEELELPVSINANNLPSNDNINNSVSSIFNAFKDTEEDFSTYSVYIIREGDNLDSVITKYNTTRDILSEYNDLSDVRIGTKIIVPSTNE